jgi:hypothetical protein
VDQQWDITSLPFPYFKSTGKTDDLCSLSGVIKSDAGKLIRSDDTAVGPLGEGVEAE